MTTMEEVLNLVSERDDTLLEWIESVSWGRWCWKFKEWMASRKLLKLTDSNRDNTINREMTSLRAQAKIARTAWQYGKPTNFSMKSKIDELRGKGLAKQELRTAVIGNVINRKGVNQHSSAALYVLFCLGVAWHIVATISISLLIALSITLPLPIVSTITAVSMLTIFYWFCWGVMQPSSIGAFRSAKAIKSATKS